MNQALGQDVTTRGAVRLPEIRARRFDHVFGQPPIANLLTLEQQTRIRDASELVEYRNGSTVFCEGNEASHIYLTCAGIVRISRTAESGRRQVLSFMLPGDIFGFPENSVYLNSAKAVGAATLYRISWQRLVTLMQEDPLLQTSLLVRMAFDLRQAQKRILVLGQQNVSQRLASFLLELTDHADFHDEARMTLTLPLSRFDLADYLGTSSETVVRTLSRMEKDGLVTRLSPRLLRIESIEGLSGLLRGRRRND